MKWILVIVAGIASSLGVGVVIAFLYTILEFAQDLVIEGGHGGIFFWVQPFVTGFGVTFPMIAGGCWAAPDNVEDKKTASYLMTVLASILVSYSLYQKWGLEWSLSLYAFHFSAVIGIVLGFFAEAPRSSE